MKTKTTLFASLIVLACVIAWAAEREIQVTIVGMVKTPGLVRIPPSATLTEAIEKAGGFYDNSDRARIEVRRAGKPGFPNNPGEFFDADEIAAGKAQCQLRNNDLVLVKKRE